jgi:hypothetical protein
MSTIAAAALADQVLAKDHPALPNQMFKIWCAVPMHCNWGVASSNCGRSWTASARARCQQGGAISVVITRRIINPVELVVGAMKRILHGDLTGEEMAIASRTPRSSPNAPARPPEKNYS